MRLCLVASKPTDSVIFGFLPAAAGLGLEVVLLTDQPEEHKQAQARSLLRPRPGCAPHNEGRRPDAGARAGQERLPGSVAGPSPRARWP